jgi:hypothetical protein
MQLDHIIQKGVWAGSAEQIACIEQAARDANFEGYESLAQYLHTIDKSHVDETAEFDRGPIAVEARERYSVAFRVAWERSRVA